MDCLAIDGGRPLVGSVAASGSKNAALPILAASLLTDGPVRLRRIPGLTDVRTLLAVLAGLDVAIEQPAPGQLLLQVGHSDQAAADPRLVRRMRASFCVLGPLLARRGRAIAPLPGGCRIGARPIDLHLAGLASLGADIRIERGLVIAQAQRLQGATIRLTGPHGPTVTGTANVLCAATLARGRTTIRGAACEPEIVDLGEFLIALGARISGLGTDTIEVRGVDQLGSADYEIIPDRIEAATLLLAGAITRSQVRVTDVRPAHMSAVLDACRQLGFGVEIGDDWVRLSVAGPVRPSRLTAEPYPGFPTDLQAPFTAVLALATGRSQIQDLVFPDRFRHLSQMRRAGAQVCTSDAVVSIEGIERFRPATMTASDLRAGAALVLIGLAAKDRTLIRGCAQIDRGYEALEQKLAKLGARLERVAAESRGVNAAELRKPRRQEVNAAVFDRTRIASGGRSTVGLLNRSER